MNYAELSCRTNYSFLRGASHPHELVAQAARLGVRALAVTDDDGVYGMPKAYLASKDHPALQLIVGARLTVAEYPSLILLARDRAAYGVLCRMLTQSHAGVEKGKAKLATEDFFSLARAAGASGLVAIASCEGGIDYGALKDCFGARLFIPLSRFLDGFDASRTERAFAAAKRFGVRLVATNDVHYHLAERQLLQDLLTAIRENTPLSQLGTKAFANGERYLKSPAEMSRLFADCPEALAATLEIAESCTFSPSELRYRYPSEWIPKGHTAQSYLEDLVWQGAKERYPEGVPEAVARQMGHELELVGQMQFADYFLTIWEIVDFARKRQILCQGRGSAANSVLCYCLGITAIDPVRMNLLFERFLSVERGEPPDIDVDFEHERREEVLQHVYEKYGRHRAAMVCAVITYRKRSARRDLCRMLEVPFETFEDAPKDSPLRKKIETLANLLKDFPRHLSIHTGGFTLSADPLSEIVPIEPARLENRTVVQWDKYDLDTLGLLKVDLLALGMLSALRKTLDAVGKYTLATIPADDPATYEMIRRADNVGVFQLESRAQMNMSGRLLPQNYYDLVVQVAIVRPGPIVGKMVHPYLKRRRGLESPDVPHPKLAPILKRTLGIPLFQEQVMKMSMAVAGFTPGEADQLRRAIGAWRSSGAIEKWGERLRRGLLAEGLPEDYVAMIFEQLKGFAEYGFPESHAASFALIAYASAYLKCHYPAAFTCSLINSQPMGFYSNHSLIDDVKRHGVRVLPLDLNRSAWDCTLEEGAIRLGFRVVRHLARREADRLLAAQRHRPFASLADFLSRVRLRRNMVEQLALGDAFHIFGLTQRQALWQVLAWQPGLFAPVQGGLFQPEGIKPLNEGETLVADYQTYDLCLRFHPMQVLRRALGAQGVKIPALTTCEAKESSHGGVIRIAGMVIVRQRPPTAHGTIFATLEDETGFLDLILHRSTAERCEDLFTRETFLLAKGVIQRDRQTVSLLVRELQAVRPAELAGEETSQFDEPLIRAREWH